MCIIKIIKSNIGIIIIICRTIILKSNSNASCILRWNIIMIVNYMRHYKHNYLYNNMTFKNWIVRLRKSIKSSEILQAPWNSLFDKYTLAVVFGPRQYLFNN